MSRIGIKPITLAQNLKVEIGKTKITVKNSNEEITVPLPPRIEVKEENGKLVVSGRGEGKNVKALHGLTRSLLNNAVTGLTEPFKKTLEIKGVGFRVRIEGDKLVLNLGFTHEVSFPKPKGIDFEVKGTKITVKGANKQLVGETAARIKKIKVPDIYKGKGIRYEGEVIKLKAGKAVKGATGPGK